MNSTSISRPKTPIRTRSHSQNSSQSTAHSDSINFGTASELTGIRTPPTAKAIPLQTPSYSLSGRTKESLRLARERQLESVKKQPTTARKTSNASFGGNAHRGGATGASSTSRARVTTTSSFNPVRKRPITPVSTFRSTTPVTPSSPSRHSRTTSSVSVTSSPKTPTSLKTTPVGPSTAVRDAIAKAKQAAKAKAAQKTPSMRSRKIDYSNETSFEEIDNPFNITPGTPPLVVQLRRAIETGRTTGNLNISNLELTELPEDVYTIYDLSNKPVVVDFSSKSARWYESVDLERFNAAGNEIPSFDNRIIEEFGGIRHFDMHANKLSTLPSKFNTLQFLRTLNLSKNNLSFDVLDCITQISTLIELYLSHNEIEGPLTPDISALESLQILDLDGNKITSIPEEIGKLQRMRTLLLAGNQLESIPWTSLENLNDLNQLDISSNRLSGDLIPSSLPPITLGSLSNFDIHSNNLESLPSNMVLPSLTQFNATQNTITTTGTFFITTPRLCHLALSQNQLPSLPDGIVHLQHLRTFDISNNIIEHIDPRLGLLDDLTTFMWQGNLIRQRNWGSMDTEGIKSALRAKADEAVLKGIEEEIALMNVNTCHGECGGVLDLGKKLKDKGLKEEEVLRHVHAGHFPVVTKVVMQGNALTIVPREVGLLTTTLTTLDLSRNFLTGKLREDTITLENLSHLDISANKLDTLTLLPSTLIAPNLTSLEISYNSLTSLIPLHSHYPNLTTLYANSNQLTSLVPSDLEGLEMVQVNNNDINKLPSELALLKSLKILGVDGNTFRVPGRRIVEQGSAALLEWLRGRCVVND